MAAEIKFTSHVPEVLAAFDGKKEVLLEKLGITGEGYGKLELERAPRRIDTGNLRNSINHKSEENAAVIGTNVEYARYVHDGTSRMAANRFLRNAISEHQGDYKKIIENTLKG